MVWTTTPKNVRIGFPSPIEKIRFFASTVCINGKLASNNSNLHYDLDLDRMSQILLASQHLITLMGLMNLSDSHRGQGNQEHIPLEQRVNPGSP